MTTIHKCVECGKEHSLPSNWCSDFCFSLYYQRVQIETLSFMLNAVFGDKDATPRTKQH
jgi:hypothetical protein